MVNRKDDIEHSIFILIEEIEMLEDKIEKTFPTINRENAALQNYFFIKIGMCLSLICSYMEHYTSPSPRILKWFYNSHKNYRALRDFIYNDKGGE